MQFRQLKLDQERQRQEEEEREAKRQSRKLDFLLAQTEIFAHFMSHRLGVSASSSSSTPSSPSSASVPSSFSSSSSSAAAAATTSGIEDASQLLTLAASEIQSTLRHTAGGWAADVSDVDKLAEEAKQATHDYLQTQLANGELIVIPEFVDIMSLNGCIIHVNGSFYCSMILV
jgi:hypothetical protein